MNPAETSCIRYHNREEFVTSRLQQLEEQTNYPIVQNNGQRVCGPPKQWNQPVPLNGSEIFIGSIPRWILEDELMKIFSRVGRIYKIRLMVDYSGYNRGFAFITYENPEVAKMAVKCLNHFLIRPNRVLGVCKSVDNRRLFIGGISEDKTKDDVQAALEYYVEDLTGIIMYPPATPDLNGSRRNRGYVFAEFGAQRSAAIARRLLSAGVKLWEDAAAPISVNWADPIPEVDPSIMEMVKRLYVRNLPYHLTTEQMKFYLSQLIPMDSITRVHKINDYAFVHFNNKKDAELALGVLNEMTILGNKIEVTWSRPRMYSKDARFNRPAENFCRSVPPKMYKKVQMLQNGRPANPAASLGSWSQSSNNRNA